MPDPRSILLSLLSIGWALLGTGCQTAVPSGEDQESTVYLSPLPVVGDQAEPRPTRVEFPMKLIGGLVVVQAQDESGPWNFLIDTGSSATLVSPEFAIRRRSRRANPDPGTVWLRDAAGVAIPVESVFLDKVDFGPAHFSNVRALVYDCSVISDHLGIRIDGVLGFNLFADARLTLDYPGRRIVMSQLDDNSPLRGDVLPFTKQNGVPFIDARIGDQPILALIDSGSDGSLSIDPAGLDLQFAVPPRRGTLIGTLHGNHRQILGRLSETLEIGEFRVDQPVIDLSGQLTSIGGEILHHFEITFDQSTTEVAFYRPVGNSSIPSPVKMSSGVSFSKVRAYWRITAVAPGSPAEATGFSEGDLVIRLNGEPVEEWDLNRYHDLVESGAPIAYTFLRGRDEVTLSAATFALVP
jgi:hypothetical protein